MFKQISEYFKSILSKFQCGFREGFSTQNSISNPRKMEIGC